MPTNVAQSYPYKRESEADRAAAIAATGAVGIKDMGKVIGELKGKYAGQMDFAKVGPMVKAVLSGG